MDKKAKKFICYRFIPWFFCINSLRESIKPMRYSIYHHASDFVHSIGNDGMKLKRCEIVKILAQNECESLYPPLALSASCFCAICIAVLCYSLFFAIFILALLFNRIFPILLSTFNFFLCSLLLFGVWNRFITFKTVWNEQVQPFPMYFSIENHKHERKYTTHAMGIEYRYILTI